MTSERRDLIQVVCAAALLMLLVSLVMFSVKVAFGRTLYPGQWAQIDPVEREWFKSQRSPNGIPCCDTADGTYAEEDLRDGHYWTRFGWRHPGDGDNIIHEETTDWVQVPDDKVIHDPNRHGAPVVWWYWASGFGAEAKVGIRCYAPGGGV